MLSTACLIPKCLFSALRAYRSTIKIEKFRGYIPPKEIVGKLIVPPYDVLNSQEARQMAAGNQYSFLHCNKPEIDLDQSIDAYNPAVYETAKKNLNQFVKNGWLKKDKEARLYVYSQKMGGHTQYGVMGLSSIEDYESNRIKKHELTRKDKEEDRTKFVDVQNANIGPVFLAYNPHKEIDKLVDKTIKGKPYSKSITDDKVEHTLWMVSPEDSDAIISIFATIPTTYIADGHHRAASAYNVGRKRREEFIKKGGKLTGNESFLYFLTILYPADQLKILDYNRLLKSYNNHSEAEIMKLVSEKYSIEEIKGDPKPKCKHSHSMYIGGKWFSITLKKGIADERDPIKSLDVDILFTNILKPVFNIQDPRTDKMIDFVGGIRGIKELESRCAKDCKVAFAMYPVSIQEVMSVADSSMIMPPKSTWFEPKPRSGLVVNIFEQ
jgi:uncharacterized protein (DUF1015 family)